VTHYEVLGVPPGASTSEIRRAYVALARRHHPDFHVAAGARVRAEAERRMQHLNEAWLVLGDPVRRARYDGGRPALPEPHWVPGTVHPDFVPVDPDDDGVFLFDDGEDDGGGRPVPRWQQLLPPGLLAGAVAVGATAAVVHLRGLFVVAVILLLAALAGFVLTPMLAVLNTYERNPDR
jgi:hypothetical protein